MPFPHEARSPISPSKRENHALSMATTPQAPIGSSNRERNFSNSPKPRLPTDHQGSDATKTETKWRASEDIRPKGWEEHKESEAVHKREQEKSLKSKTPCEHGATCFHLQTGVCMYHHKQSHLSRKSFSSKKPCRDGGQCSRRPDCAFVHEQPQQVQQQGQQVQNLQLKQQQQFFQHLQQLQRKQQRQRHSPPAQLLDQTKAPLSYEVTNEDEVDPNNQSFGESEQEFGDEDISRELNDSDLSKSIQPPVPGPFFQDKMKAQTHQR
jgi:hypothetical protein